MFTDDVCELRPLARARNNSHLNLAARFSWLDVLPLIDETWVSELPDRLLPQNFACPFCKPSTTASIYADTRDGGQWIHCPGCGFAGDILEFAGRKLNCTAIGAVWRLLARRLQFPSDLPLEKSLASYAHYLRRRERINELWRQAQRNSCQDECRDSARLIAKFHLDSDVTDREWPERGGRFVGVESRKRIWQAFYPGRKSDRQWGVHPRFTGGWHSHVLVLPMYDLPKRMSGFTFLGLRQGQPAYKVRDVYSRAGRPINQDPGIWMFDNLAQPNNRAFPNGELFVTNDPLDAFWLQIHHLRLYPQPLPLIVAPWGCRPRTVWSYKWPAKPIFWSRKPTFRFLELAKLLGAPVAVMPLHWQAFIQSCRTMWPAGWLHEVSRQAVPVAQLTI